MDLGCTIVQFIIRRLFAWIAAMPQTTSISGLLFASILLMRFSTWIFSMHLYLAQCEVFWPNVYRDQISTQWVLQAISRFGLRITDFMLFVSTELKKQQYEVYSPKCKVRSSKHGLNILCVLFSLISTDLVTIPMLFFVLLTSETDSGRRVIVLLLLIQKI